MTSKLRELLAKKLKIAGDMRSLLDKANTENREMTSEEDASYEAMNTDLDATIDAIKTEERNEERAKKLAMVEETRDVDRSRSLAAQDGDIQPHKTQFTRQELRAKLAKEWNICDKLILGSARSKPEYEKAFVDFLAHGDKMPDASRAILQDVEEFRALQADIDTAGGYLVAPEQFIARLIQKLDNLVFFRRYATVIPIANAASIGAPMLDNDISDPNWTAEILTGTADTTLDFEKRSLTPHPLAKPIRVSKKLIRVSTLSIDQIVRDRLAYKFSVVEENAFLNGTGSNQPLGVFLASNAGITTSRDVSTGNTTTAIKADNLIECKYTLKAQYRRGCRWIFHRDALKMIRKLKDGDGNYLWRPGISSDRPDTILDLPFDESEYCPHTFTTGKYVGILGDFSFYWIVDAMNMQIQVVTELYAATNQNGYFGRKETDGMPTVEEAFVRVTLT